MKLTIYSNAKNAIAQYKTVDEVKEFRDKALAVEAYAKQANDYDLERDAAIARVRAERKCGELLRDMDKATPSGNNQYGEVEVSTSGTRPKTLEEMGVSRNQSSRWMKLAQVPEKEFEDAINLPGSVPSANHLIRNNKPVEQGERMDKNALWLWGRLIDMERHGLFDKTYSELYSEMTDAMRKDADTIIPKLNRWINEQH